MREGEGEGTREDEGSILPVSEAELSPGLRQPEWALRGDGRSHRGEPQRIRSWMGTVFGRVWRDDLYSTGHIALPRHLAVPMLLRARFDSLAHPLRCAFPAVLWHRQGAPLAGPQTPWCVGLPEALGALGFSPQAGVD